ncbi:uncharacterized protein LOC134191657 [Corticium candelabrum]|uniref:uncharacterized protein LOC134191657 n=1 Tax=Corticium candelabrum TaxID=121492 RepID=UPI002E2648FC|nr:uncharacterized protein LOC134191657 [Corticium candelabrum]
MPQTLTISLPDDTGLTVPRSINFNPEILTTLSKLLVQTTSNSQNNRRSARQNAKQRRHEENRSRTASEVSDYTPDKRLLPKVKKKKARPHSSGPSSYGPKSSIDIPRVDQSSLEGSDGQLTESNEYPEKTSR